MKRAITNQEAIAIKNELESLRIKASQKPEFLAKLSPEARFWITDNYRDKSSFGKLPEHFQKEIIKSLYDLNGLQTQKQTQRDVIVAFLKATKKPKYIELAEKIEMFRKSGKHSDLNEEMEIAMQIMLHGTNVLAQYPNQRGKNTTIEKEVKQIKDRERKIQRKEAKLISKFANVAKIHGRPLGLYEAIYSFLKKHYSGSLDIALSYNIKTTVTQIVHENQWDALDMLKQQDALQFVEEQTEKRIR